MSLIRYLVAVFLQYIIHSELCFSILKLLFLHLNTELKLNCVQKINLSVSISTLNNKEDLINNTSLHQLKNRQSNKKN